MKMKVSVKDITNNISADELDAGRLQETFDVSVEDGSKITLPESFNSSLREDLIKLAVASSRANRRQAYGSRKHLGKRKPMAGMKHYLLQKLLKTMSTYTVCMAKEIQAIKAPLCF